MIMGQVNFSYTINDSDADKFQLKMPYHLKMILGGGKFVLHKNDSGGRKFVLHHK